MTNHNLSLKDFEALRAKKSTRVVFIYDPKHAANYSLPSGSIKVALSDSKSYLLTHLRESENVLIVCCIYGTASEEIVEELWDAHEFSNLYNLKGGLIRWLEYADENQEDAPLCSHERVRYSRQSLLPGIGEEGQVKLKSSSILVVGCGGLGCPIISQLAAVGIGKISIIDDDVVSLSNLNRQFLFAEKDIGRKKVDVAAEFVRKQNPLCQIQTYDALLNENNVIDLICSHDIIIDATDSYETRYLINKVCVQKEKPFIFGSVQGFVGQVALFENSGNAPCYQCTFPAAPLKESRKSCDVNGVLGNLPSLIGSVQTSKALKHILFGTNDHTLFQYNFIAETYKKYQMTKNKHCFCSNEDK